MNGETHRMVGLATGAGYAAFQAKEQPGIGLVMEMLGGGVGGFWGGRLPDDLEPAISSWHRDSAHSVSVGAGIVAAMRTKVPAWQDFCREQAEAQRQKQVAATHPFIQFLHSLAVMFWHFLAGFVNGVGPGYLSHLALDCITPRSIPMFPSFSSLAA